MIARMSSPVTTRVTPSSDAAALVSMPRMRPWATVERNTLPYSMPGRRRLWAYSARPVTLARASRRGMERPICAVMVFSLEVLCAGLTRASIDFTDWIFDRWVAGSSPATTGCSSVRSRQAENMFGEKAENQIRRNRCHLIKPRFAELAFDIVFLGKPKTAIGLNAGFCGSPGRIGRQELRHVGLGAAVHAGLKQCGGLLHHQLGGAHLCIGSGKRELNALVPADRAIEDHPFLGVVGSFLDEPFGVADTFRCDENALRI